MSYSRLLIFQHVRDQLERNPSATLSDLSQKLGIHLHTAEAAIQGETGMSFRKWWDSQRLRKVKALESLPGWSRKQVAAAIGLTPSGLRRLKKRSDASSGTPGRHAP